MSNAGERSDGATGVAAGKPGRRGDLDALRGFAMVLGIALHATLAYFPFPWPVQDPRQARAFGLVFAFIHGFRMPLFFLLSGFFTMLVLERRGLRSLLAQRALRILLPLAIALVTILPLDRAVFSWALGGDLTPLEIPGRSRSLFDANVFDHLWFLWYLCWLAGIFALAAALGLAPTGRHRWWLVPASCLPFARMWSPFGPDTALGILPVPHLLLFYGSFFWFGAGTYAAEGAGTPLGRRWPWLLPVAVLVLFPAGIATIGNRPLGAVLQPAFAWSMSLGLIGLFRRCFAAERPAVRWLSDAAYWMYLIHLPLVVVCQVAVRDLPWPAGAKFLAVLAAVVALTLVSYRWCVRFTPIGWLLNGPRVR